MTRPPEEIRAELDRVQERLAASVAELSTALSVRARLRGMAAHARTQAVADLGRARGWWRDRGRRAAAVPRRGRPD